MGHKKTAKGLVQRNGIWHIEKQIKGQRIRESTRTGDKREAERHLAFVLEEHRKHMIYGDRRQYTFEQAATRYIQEETKKSLLRDAQDLKQVMPFIGDFFLEQVHAGTLDKFIQKRKNDGVKSATVNRALAIVKLVLRRANARYRDENGNPWLGHLPEIPTLDWGDKRKGHALSDCEEAYLMSSLSSELQQISTFLLNTGLRSGELCALRWDWLVKRDAVTCFELPGEYMKNRQDFLVVCNTAAMEVLEARRGLHETFVFAGINGQRKDIKASGWRRGRIRAADAFERGEGKDAADGFRRLRVHDLRHTFGTRLRSLNVAFETRKDLLGHVQGDVTTLYSHVEVKELWRGLELLSASVYEADILRFPAKSPQKTTSDKED
ncbi:tyrosine-type recombinase/integrase [Pseudomonadales bacterium]|nr:tyrosine-type recombinase/integrase [Pseudomonadales bacterium]